MNATTQKPDFQHRTAIAGWIFMTIWLGMLVMFTYLFMRDGGFHQFDYPIEVGIMLLFWMAGLAGASASFESPMTTIWVRDGHVEISEIRPFRQDRIRVPIGEVAPPVIKKTPDSDGETFTCLFDVPGGRTITLGMFNYIEDAEKQLSEFNAALERG